MTDVERCHSEEAAYEEHLDRSETVWNRWSNWYRLSEQDFGPMRARLIDRLVLTEGIACSMSGVARG